MELSALVLASVILGPGHSLPGVWHNSTCVGSGYCELYAFFPDGSFQWHENQMDGVALLRERWGSWISEGDSLVLSVDSVRIWVGGRMVPAECSTGTDSMLVDFEDVVRPLSPPETLMVHVSGFRMDRADGDTGLPVDMYGVDLDCSRFWRIASDPAEIDRMH